MSELLDVDCSDGMDIFARFSKEADSKKKQNDT